jgi:hypothetical protein
VVAVAAVADAFAATNTEAGRGTSATAGSVTEEEAAGEEEGDQQ